MDNWSREELTDAILAYKEIQEKNRKNEKVVKSKIYNRLSEKYRKRTPKAFEYRMQNISFVLTLSGRDWIEGLIPARNVGTKVIQEIEEILAELENRNANTKIIETVDVITRLTSKTKIAQRPLGNKHPNKTTRQTLSYQRDLVVIEWILENANGNCELCDDKAPFITSYGLPFLEVHHVRHLADSGSDTTSNAVALCPNCHKEVHYGIDSNKKKNQLYSKISRLIKE